jgi:chromosome segregation protein
MYLKTLEIQGFKSFAERTVLEFHRGVTGSWGERLRQVERGGRDPVGVGETSAKALRGGEMADVIFNGTEKRKPLGWRR